MALDIGIRSDIHLTAAYSDPSNRFSKGKAMTGAGRGLFTGVCLVKAIVLFDVKNNVSSL